MPKAIYSSHGLTRGVADFPPRGARKATVREAVHDGDTVTVVADGSLSVRFLGIDTPEVSFELPEAAGGTPGRFVSIKRFEEYLTDPLDPSYADSSDFAEELGDGLVERLRSCTGADCAQNHLRHAEAAHRRLEELVQADVDECEDADDFRFFMAFAYEIMDGYGRFLCYLNKQERDPQKRKLSYNERMLENGMACPYFIWPNINPFRKKPSLEEAVPPPHQLRAWVEEDRSLQSARAFVRSTRRNRNGIFSSSDPLKLLPFELRYLARRRPPSRYVLDLSADSPKLLKPTEYYKIPHLEDRLFINAHFVPLFKNKGYEVSTGWRERFFWWLPRL